MASVFTHAGKAIVTNRIRAGGTEPLQAGWGKGAGTAAVTDTTLFTEAGVDITTNAGTTRTAGTSSQVTTSQTNDTYRVVATRTATEAGTITNAGLFDSNTIGAGNLLCKGDFTGIVLANGDAIAFTFNLQFT